MTSANGSEEVLKQDTRGRVRVSGERRETVLDEFERLNEGLTGAKFARLAGINVSGKRGTSMREVGKRHKVYGNDVYKSGREFVSGAPSTHLDPGRSVERRKHKGRSTSATTFMIDYAAAAKGAAR